VKSKCAFLRGRTSCAGGSCEGRREVACNLQLFPFFWGGGVDECIFLAELRSTKISALVPGAYVYKILLSKQSSCKVWDSTSQRLTNSLIKFCIQSLEKVNSLYTRVYGVLLEQSGRTKNLRAKLGSEKICC
jgi:hypothetical protein